MKPRTSQNPRLRILLVDDHAVVRVGLRNLINDESDLEVIGEAGSCEEAIREAASTSPDVIILDLRLPDGSGVDAIPSLRQSAPSAKVLVLTSYADDTLLLAALKAGVDGYLLKDIAESDLVGAVRQVAQDALVSPKELPCGRSRDGLTTVRLEESRLDQLTGQERRVFELVGRGHTNLEAAQLMGLTEKTVRNYLSRVFEKLGVTRRSEIVAFYMSTRPWHR